MKNCVVTIFVMAVLSGAVGMARAGAPADDIADAVIQAGIKPISPESLADDFAPLTKFIRHDASGMVLFSDGGGTNGYVRHAQAHFDTAPAATDPAGKHPAFSIAFELADQPEFSFADLAGALEQRLGKPDRRTDVIGAVSRAWALKQQPGRTLTIARAEASDNGDPVTIVQLVQER